MPWRIGRWVLLGSLLPLAVGIFLLAGPVRNSGVQDCGVPAIFSITGRTNARLPSAPDRSSVDRLSDLRAQTPCSELVDQRLRWGTWAIGVFFVLALAGAALGLADDRLRLRRSPLFEQLLRERPAGAPGEVWDRPVVPRDDIGVSLPEVESSDVEALVVWSVVLVCVLLIVSGVGNAWDAIVDVNLLGLVAALLLAVAARLVAGGQLALADSGARPSVDRLRRAVPVATACDWAGRIRPAFGAVGVEGHALIRAGVERAQALLDLGVAYTLAAIAHVGLLGFLFLVTLAVGVGGGSWPKFSPALVLIALAMAVVGVVMLTARVRQLPCPLGRPTLDRLVERWRHAPVEVVAAFGLAVVMPLVHGAVLWTLVTSLGDQAPLAPILFWTVFALAFRAFAPVPEGLVAADVVLVIGFSLAGVAPVVAVAAVLLWRVLMVWLPMIPGYVVTKSLVRRGTL